MTHITLEQLSREELEELFTLDNIFNHASEEELFSIVGSILGRTYQNSSKWIKFQTSRTDKQVMEVVKGLRIPA
tara:strand:- start:925 stop:1146 length:222 start_codon:yes stop_codon:yes gene_type:complete